VDRVDLRVQLNPVSAGAFTPDAGESSATVRQRVAAARLAAEERWRPHGIRTNAEVSGPLLRRKFRLSRATMAPLQDAMDRGLISMRGADRCLRVAWTLADLAGRNSPAVADVATALSFRQAGGVS
jgi:magnesium chelatase family protein